MADWLDVEIAGPQGPVAAMDWGGSGEPVVFLHGGGGNAGEWAPLVYWLGSGFRCIALDSFGHGRTPAVGELTFERQLAEVDTVIDHFGVAGRVTLVGSSSGGTVAVCHAARRGRCRAVVGVDSMPTRVLAGLEPNPDAFEHDARYYAEMGWGWSGDEPSAEERIGSWTAAGDPEPFARRAHQLGTDGLFHQVPSTQVCADLHNLGLRPGNPFVDESNYGRVRCPVLLLCGTDGVAADNAAYVDAMPQRYPAVTVSWVDGGHGLHRETPDVVADLIRGFL
jgi:pimeloyl-ACP methyl ester carboxylesterase